MNESEHLTFMCWIFERFHWSVGSVVNSEVRCLRADRQNQAAPPHTTFYGHALHKTHPSFLVLFASPEVESSLISAKAPESLTGRPTWNDER